MYDIFYMRNVDPDQEQPWTGVYTTDNFVQYQPPRSGETRRVKSGAENTALVVAKGTRYPELVLGLGTVHPNAHVSHYGFRNNDVEQGSGSCCHEFMWIRFCV